MADEVRPASEVPQPGHAVPHVTDVASGGDLPPIPGEAAPLESATQAGEPSMADAAADLAAPDRPAESFAPLPGAVAAPRKSSVLPALLACIGLVLIALLGINLYMMANPPGNDVLPALQSDVGAMKQRLGALEAKPAAAAALGPIDAHVKALDASVAKLSSDLDAVRKQASAAPAQAAGAVEANTGRLDALDKQVHDLDGALAELKSTVAGMPRVDLGPLQAKATDLQASVDSLKTALAAIPKVDLGPIDGKISALEGRLAAQDDRLKPLETEFASSRTRAAPLAVTAQAILQALDEGKPFAPDVAALKALGVDDAKLTALRPAADKGAPTQAELVSGFASVRGTLVRASAPKVTGTVLDRVMASAESIVKIRPAGSSPGNDPDAIASRIAADLDGSAFPEALAEWERLPDASKAASAGWAEGLKQRVAAEGAARSIAASAIATLGTAP